MEDERPSAIHISEKLQRLEHSLNQVSSTNPDLAYVVRRMLGLHLCRLDGFIDAAQGLAANGQDLSRENILSLLCFVIAFQQNH